MLLLSMVDADDCVRYTNTMLVDWHYRWPLQIENDADGAEIWKINKMEDGRRCCCYQ